MKTILVCILFVVLPILAIKVINIEVPTNVEELDEDDASIPDVDAFAKFLLKHGKKYINESEKLLRLKIFSKNRKLINDHNNNYKNKKVGFNLRMNKHGDLTADEFSEKRKGLIRDSPPTNTFTPPSIRTKRQTNPALDYRANSRVAAVQDQGECGSCYSFSSIGSLEGRLAIAVDKLYKLSEQQIVDCTFNKGNNGCHGGRPQIVYNYIKDIGGIDFAQTYPYNSGVTLNPGTCAYNESARAKVQVVKSVNVSPGEDNLKAALESYGPIAVNIDARNDTFHFYSSGVYDEPTCLNAYSKLDHSVLLIGYGTNSAGVDYWTVKNSWGTDWGMAGFIKMSRNKNNQCGIATDASYPEISIQ